MAYKSIITDRAEELLDRLVCYLVYDLKNEQAASHLLNDISKIYDRIEDNPLQFPECRDLALKSKGYREAILTDMGYLVVFHIEEDTVYIMGVFHELEDYSKKL